MISDGVRYSDIPDSRFSDIRKRALEAVIGFLERSLGVSVTYDARTLPFERVDIVEPMRLAHTLQSSGIITDINPLARLPDEPRLRSWSASCNDSTKHRSGGSSFDNDVDALHAALAEALERYIWYEQDDHFQGLVQATADEIEKRGRSLRPERFAAFSESERSKDNKRALKPDASYIWIKGESLASGTETYIPAQTATGIRDFTEKHGEPLIRERTTVGLSTWPTKSGARLGGVLEIIERDAYMIMWLNQISPTRISLLSLRARDPALAKKISYCERYQLKVHILAMPTDAPAHTICALVEDTTGNAPRFSLGMSAHRSLSSAAEKALTEALRMRANTRRWIANHEWDASTPTERIGHYDRLYYRTLPQNAKQLEFLLTGPERDAPQAAWEGDTVEEHLERILSWCRENSYECISVSLSHSAKNPTPFHVEQVIMPDLQPAYLDESERQTGGTRWKKVPGLLGLKGRSSPFVDEPHPFC